MKGYAAIHRRIFTSSLAADAGARRLFMELLVLADYETGHVDYAITPLSMQLGVPRDEIERALSVLMGEDSESRSKAEGGRRLVPHESGRGWQIVNYLEYRHQASGRGSQQAATQRKREQRAREAEQARREAEHQAELDALREQLAAAQEEAERLRRGCANDGVTRRDVARPVTPRHASSRKEKEPQPEKEPILPAVPAEEKRARAAPTEAGTARPDGGAVDDLEAEALAMVQARGRPCLTERERIRLDEWRGDGITGEHLAAVWPTAGSEWIISPVLEERVRAQAAIPPPCGDAPAVLWDDRPPPEACDVATAELRSLIDRIDAAGECSDALRACVATGLDETGVIELWSPNQYCAQLAADRPGVRVHFCGEVVDFSPPTP